MAPDVERIRRLRAEQPEAVALALTARERRPLLGEDGRLLIVAADHPARGALGVGGRPAAMADRGVLLRNLLVALSHPAVDGVLATADVVEDLAILGALDRRIVAGSINRGGLQSAVFEMDDRGTAYDVAAVAEQGLDFAKLLLRINYADAGTAATLEFAARAVGEAARLGLPIMIEPFVSAREGGRVVNDLSPDAVIRSVAIASGLGPSSAYTWLKLPVVDEMERVLAATTLPVLLLGGDPTSRPDETYASWDAALRLPGVRGLVAGRALLYPPDDDVAAAIDIAAALVHAGTPTRTEPIA
jgi:DhnA family fructose-bisphosphate aldolase class Ia